VLSVAGVVVMGGLLTTGFAFWWYYPYSPLIEVMRSGRGLGCVVLGELAGDGEGGRAEVAGGGSTGGQAPGHSGGFGDDEHNALAGR